MRKLILLFFLLPLFSFSQDFPERPTPPRLVNDMAGFLSSEQRESLEKKLVAYNDTTSTQIAIVTVTSIGQYDAAGYSFELAERWGIGQKGKNNGLLILLVKETHDIFIAPGYGLEEYIPDAIAKRITEEILIPHFREDRFYEGLDKATDVIFARLTGKFKGDEIGSRPVKKRKSNLIPIIIIIIIILIVMRRRGGGGGFGGRSILFGSGMGWGGFSSGGFSSGRGSFGGGGFGGFGGGSFGGGGAGGRW